jgi:hypothetical protein
MMKKAVIGAAGAVVLMGATAAQAQLSPPNVAGQWDYTGPNVTNVKFTGPTTLVKSGVPLDCTLTVYGDVDFTSTSRLDITVKDGEVTGSFLCNTVDLNLDPNDSTTWWHAYNPTAGQGVSGSASQSDTNALDVVEDSTFTNLNVDTPLGNCSGSVFPVDFKNGDTSVNDPSAFVFTAAGFGSDCSVTGTLKSVSGGDANAY